MSKNMETKNEKCSLCQNGFDFSLTRFGSVDISPRYCEECEQSLHALQHRHSLSIDVASLKEVSTIIAQLSQIEQPAEGLYSSHHSSFTRSSPDGDSYWLCYYYDQISLDLLTMLVMLKSHYKLYDTETHKDSLRYWPDYSAPQGVLAPLLQRNRIRTGK